MTRPHPGPVPPGTQGHPGNVEVYAAGRLRHDARMRACVIALLCVLCSCSDKEGVRILHGPSSNSGGVRANHVATWRALEAILEHDGYTVRVTRFTTLLKSGVLSPSETAAEAWVPSALVATRKDGPTLDITVVPDHPIGGAVFSIGGRWQTPDPEKDRKNDQVVEELYGRLLEKVGKG